MLQRTILRLFLLLIVGLLSLWAAPISTADGLARWTAEYFNNSFLIPPAVLTRQDPAIAFNWGSGSPGAGVNQDNFSARWNADVYLPAGRYRFWARADDYVRVTLDYAAQPIIDTFASPPAGQLVSQDVTLQTGYHHIRVEYSEGAGDAFIYFTWADLSTNPTGPNFPGTPTQQQPPASGGSTGSQWTAQYYANPNLNGSPSAIRTEASPTNNWGAGSPSPNIPADGFSARWVSTQVLSGGTYRLNVRDLPTTINSNVIARINPGETYPIVGRNPESTWWQLEINGTYGWVFAQYIDAANTSRVPITIGSTAQPPSTGILGTALNDVNIRREPNVNSRLLGTLPNGRAVNIVGRNASATWWQINYQGIVGWVIADAIDTPARNNLSRIPVTG